MSIIYNPIALIFISYGIGALLTGLLNSMGVLQQFSHFNFLNDRWTRKLGVLSFGWLVKNSFMRFFNQSVYLKNKKDKASLLALVDEMTKAEMGHLIGFVFLVFVNVYMLISGVDLIYAAVFALVNIVFNLYLVFIQQYNKRRIRKLLVSIL